MALPHAHFELVRQAALVRNATRGLLNVETANALWFRFLGNKGLESENSTEPQISVLIN